MTRAYRRRQRAKRFHSRRNSLDKRDTETIIEFLLGVPCMGVVLLILFKATGSGWFLIGGIMLIIIGGINVSRAMINKANKVRRTFT